MVETGHTFWVVLFIWSCVPLIGALVINLSNKAIITYETLLYTNFDLKDNFLAIRNKAVCYYINYVEIYLFESTVGWNENGL